MQLHNESLLWIASPLSYFIIVPSIFNYKLLRDHEICKRALPQVTARPAQRWQHCQWTLLEPTFGCDYTQSQKGVLMSFTITFDFVFDALWLLLQPSFFPNSTFLRVILSMFPFWTYTKKSMGNVNLGSDLPNSKIFLQTFRFKIVTWIHRLISHSLNSIEKVKEI